MWSTVVMRLFKILLFIFFTVNYLSVSANPFEAKYKAKITNYDSSSIAIEIKEVIDPLEDSFKVGTVLSGKVIEHKMKRRPSIDEALIISLDSAKLNNSSIPLDSKLQIRPRRLLSIRNEGNAFIGATGLTLGLTLDFLTVGLPVSRGGLALWNSGFEVKGAKPGQSKMKAAAKGFLMGAFFPLPQLVSKGKDLNASDKDLDLVLFKTKEGKLVHSILN